MNRNERILFYYCDEYRLNIPILTFSFGDNRKNILLWKKK